MYSSEEGLAKAIMSYAMKRKAIIMSKIRQDQAGSEESHA